MKLFIIFEFNIRMYRVWFRDCGPRWAGGVQKARHNGSAIQIIRCNLLFLVMPWWSFFFD